MEAVKLENLTQNTIKAVEKPTTNNKEEIKLRSSAKQLEGLFLTFVLKAMEKTIPKFDKQSSSNNLVSMMFSSVMGEDLAKHGGVGLAEFIYQHMKKDDVQKLNLPAQNWVEMLPNRIIPWRNNE
ncbi:MAG: hypothetical protein J7L94_06255 [Caldisericaceae bacterium]|nr:hypothetical protein [Caldisericaceae bacterium]